MKGNDCFLFGRGGGHNDNGSLRPSGEINTPPRADWAFAARDGVSSLLPFSNLGYAHGHLKASRLWPFFWNWGLGYIYASLYCLGSTVVTPWAPSTGESGGLSRSLPLDKKLLTILSWWKEMQARYEWQE